MNKLILTALVFLLTLAPKAYADMGEDTLKLQTYIELAGKVGSICSLSLSPGMNRSKLCDTFKILDRQIQAFKEKYHNRPDKNQFYSMVQQTGGLEFENHQNRYFNARVNLQALGEINP